VQRVLRVVAAASIAASAVLGWPASPWTADAQTPAKTYRVGILTGAFSGAFPESLRPSLRDLGYAKDRT